MSVEDFPADRIKRIPVNLPFARVPTCEHDPGTGDSFKCDRCPQIEALTTAACDEFLRQSGGVTVERAPMRSCISTLLGMGFKIAPPPSPDEKVENLDQHLAWLDQFSVDDDEIQERNWRDNMMRIRTQVDRMRRDLSPFQDKSKDGLTARSTAASPAAASSADKEGGA